MDRTSISRTFLKNLVTIELYMNEGGCSDTRLRTEASLADFKLVPGQISRCSGTSSPSSRQIFIQHKLDTGHGALTSSLGKVAI